MFQTRKAFRVRGARRQVRRLGSGRALAVKPTDLGRGRAVGDQGDEEGHVAACDAGAQYAAVMVKILDAALARGTVMAGLASSKDEATQKALMLPSLPPFPQILRVVGGALQSRSSDLRAIGDGPR